MKKAVILVALFFSGILLAQENNPELEIVGQRVKTTYYFENGKIQQEGFYKDGKLDGVWTSYDSSGNKLAVGSYENGSKTGKWFFWYGNSLSEVDYSNNSIALVKNSRDGAIANKN
jgi:antitoxin component YwqK of YwqJK toxin-antitoxin module